MIKLRGELNYCICKGRTHNLEECFIKLKIHQAKIKVIDMAFAKQDMEMVLYILNILPKKSLVLVTTMEGMENLTLADVKAKLRAFYHKCKFQDTTAKQTKIGCLYNR